MENELLDLIIQNQKLIYKIASKFYDVNKDDLYQVGVLGLIKAYKNYKNDSKAKFSTYAYDYIFGEMYNLALENKSFKVNKETLKLYKEIERARDYLAQKLGKTPNITDLSLFLELEESLINDVIASGEKLISLDDTPLYETTGYEQDLDSKILLSEEVEKLPYPEKDVIVSRYYKDLTQKETAELLGMTQVMVSRIEKKTLSKMYCNIVS